MANTKDVKDGKATIVEEIKVVDNTIPARSKIAISSIDKRVHNHETKVVKFYLHKKDKNLDVQVEKSVETNTEEV